MKGKYNIAGTYEAYKKRLVENLFSASQEKEEVEEEIAAEDAAEEVAEEVAEEAAEEADEQSGAPALPAPGAPLPALGGAMGAPAGAAECLPFPLMTPPTGAPLSQHGIAVSFSITPEGEEPLLNQTSFERPEWVVTRVMTDRGERVAMEKQHETDAEILVGNLSYEAALQASTDMSQKLEIPEYDNATDKYIGKVSSKVVRKEKPLSGSYKYN